MANVHDVAALILERNDGEMTAMKLEKLVYYAQAWHLVWEEKPLFDARIEAWANGPVVKELYDRHRGHFTVPSWDGDPSALTSSEQGTIEAVLRAYGSYTAHQLSELTHREDPWRQARAGLRDGERGNAVISTASMHEYYHGLE